MPETITDRVVEKVFSLFKDADIYLVGGTVRDKLLGKDTDDLDFAINLLPDDTEKVFQKAGYKVHDVGKAFGTIEVVMDGYIIQATTFRKNEKYQRDNRRPVVEWGTTIADDLIRRDFTINALAMDRNGEVVDLFGGKEHLAKGILETPMKAAEIFSDDPLRMLRAIRFKSRFGFLYSDGVREALASEAHRLLFLPKERILDEFTKILLGKYVGEALNDLLKYKLLNYFIPELTVLNAVDQDSKYHSKNVWLHTVGVVENSPAEVASRFAALFHDVGKPYVKTEWDGRVHFYRHEEVSALMAYSILSRLGLPRKVIEDVTYLVRNHMRTNLYKEDWSDSAVRRYVVETGAHLDKLIALSAADITSHRPEKVQMNLARIDHLKNRIEEVKNYKELKCPLDGLSIMERFSLPGGKEVGRLKDLVMAALTNGELKLGEDKEVYLKYLAEKQDIFNGV